MYETLKNVINSGDFELTSMLSRIEKFEARGRVTLEQADELRELAQEKANPNASLPDSLSRITNLEVKVRELDERIAALEGVKPEPNPEITEWVQPTGNHDAYKKGAKVMFEGKLYENVYEGEYNVWQPGVYGWQLVPEVTPEVTPAEESGKIQE